jgi:hypothetical protein
MWSRLEGNRLQAIRSLLAIRLRLKQKQRKKSKKINERMKKDPHRTGGEQDKHSRTTQHTFDSAKGLKDGRIGLARGDGLEF